MTDKSPTEIDLNEPLAVTLNAAAKLCSAHINSMRKWVKAGLVPSIVIGGRRLVPYVELKAMIENPENWTFAYSARGAASKKRVAAKMAVRNKTSFDHHVEAAD